MTSEQVIKDLRACLDFDAFGDIDRDCSKCSQEDWRVCRDNLMKQALDLINRQKVEIEKWQKEYKRACAERDAHIYTNKFIRSEAIKEFAERLKEKADKLSFQTNYYVNTDEIDNLVKEMTDGKDNA